MGIGIGDSYLGLRFKIWDGGWAVGDRELGIEDRDKGLRLGLRSRD